MVRHSSLRWLVGLLLALALGAGGYAVRTLVAQDPPGVRAPGPPPGATPAPPAVFRLARNVPKDHSPVVLDADEVFTWVEKDPGGADQAVILVRGLVLAQQNVVRARFEQGVAWIDLKQFKEAGLLRVALYAEGRVRIDQGSAGAREADRAVLDLTTRGGFRLHAHKNRVVQKAQADDPLVKRARAQGLGPVALRPPLVSGNPGRPGGALAVRQASYEEKAGTPPGVGTPTGPGSPGGLPAPSDPGSLPPPIIPGQAPAGQAPSGTPLSPPPAAAVPGASLPPLAPAGTAPPAEARPGPPAGTPPAGTVPGERTPGPPAAGPPVTSSFGPPVSGPPPGPPPLSGPPPPPPEAPPGTPPPPVPPPLPPPSRPAPPPRSQAPAGLPRLYSIVPRKGKDFNVEVKPLPNGEQAIIVTDGVIINVRNVPNVGLLDLEADRLVIWTKGGDPQKLINSLRQEGHGGNDLEFYLAGNVEIRQEETVARDKKVLRADEVYYDVNRNVAVALGAQLELRAVPRAGTRVLIAEPVYVTAPEILKLSPTLFEVTRAEVFSSKLPSDPGLKVYMGHATIEDKTVPTRGFLGRPVLNPTTGEPLTTKESIVTAQTVIGELENVPFFYTPYLRADARDPLGPLQEVNAGFSHIYGTQFGLVLNVYKLLGIQPVPGTQWRTSIDYLSYRGPALGTTFDYGGKDVFGAKDATYTGNVRAWGIYDRDYDILGAYRPENTFRPDSFRGRFLWRQAVYDLPYGFTVQSQFAALSDRNVVEQYYKREWDQDPNQSTWLYVKEQEDHLVWTALVEPNLRPWITETQWLPRFDGWVLGQSFFDRLTYNVHGSAAYASLHRTNDSTPPVSPLTDLPDSTARLDLWQELSAPFYLGPVKLAPYALLDLTSYSNDEQGQAVGRVWGGGGVRGSIPFSRVYPSIQSELWNLNGINHKIVVSANYIWAETNVSHTALPQLDRLNDDAAQQSIRDIKPFEQILNPLNGLALQTSPVFDPQLYAIRRVVLNRIDTLDNIDVLQADIRQRWQTKRGYPGLQHIIDWVVLDTSISYFPEANRDNFGHPFAFLEYNFLWNIGDRTALTSTGWADPYTGGPQVWTVGAFLNRPDRTNFYLGYRQIEPVQSRAVTGAATYIFSPKYAMTATAIYDFGTNQAVSNSLLFTRMGTDLQVSVGFTYNAMQNNFGAMVQIMPNLVPANRSFGPLGMQNFVNR